MVNISDIAKEAGLSVATVSMVMNKAARRIPIETQRRVESVAKRLGYTPNLQARSLRSKRTRSVGVMIFDITDPYCAVILRGIETSLYGAGYVAVLTDLLNDSKRLNEATQVLMGRRIEGLIAILNPMYREKDIQDAVSCFNVPVISIGRRIHGGQVASVMIDNEAGTREAISHLYELGHRKIAFIRGPSAMSDSAPRWKGIVTFAKEKGLKIAEDLVQEIRGQNSTYDEGVELTRKLMGSRTKFTALMAFDDLTAFAAIGALADAGHEVPGDCSVVGFDDIPGAAYFNPPLTTVRQHLERQGSTAADTMISFLQNPPNNSAKVMHTVMAPVLIARKSTAAVNKPNRLKIGARKRGISSITALRQGKP
jgi:LacI family transcriptional regulator